MPIQLNDTLIDSLRTLYNKLIDTKPEDAFVVKQAIDAFYTLKVQSDTEVRDLEKALESMTFNRNMEDGKKEILKRALEKYRDKNFWIRVPPYSLAAADKGAIAEAALREASEDGVDNLGT